MNVPSLYSLPLFSRATSAVHGYPTGIGPVSRTLPVGADISDLWGAVPDPVKSAAAGLINTQWVRGVIAAKKALGYTQLETVYIEGRAYVKMLNPQKVPVYIDDTGVETVVTEQKQSVEKKIDPTTGRIVTGAAIGLGVIAAAAALFFILRRR